MYPSEIGFISLNTMIMDYPRMIHVAISSLIFTAVALIDSAERRYHNLYIPLWADIWVISNVMLI